MLKLWLIRHGMTEGNKYGRYIGITDEALCPEGREKLKRIAYPSPQQVYISPLARCRETAHILFPDKPLHIIEELSECDFGTFENKNYKELSQDPDYQAWVDSGGLLPFPEGESREAFMHRTDVGFQKAVTGCIRSGIALAALVIHGGTIMNIMYEYAGEDRSYYDWHVKNGGGYLVEIDTDLWLKGRRRLKLCGAVMEG
ncbi:MAG TPA: histidine phosphatase family protein [Candidatus Blautia faecigallinarum]|uniref:Histidine phosphatase family protein n=1 Tax=Candidatus Blautia faecigallinarum TaxID=2838488 RepID=A0A9D2DSV2_9FIRM|nr:histidine phosphatase family protein [Candidatus Blautia faecigallinarum]